MTTVSLVPRPTWIRHRVPRRAGEGKPIRGISFGYRRRVVKRGVVITLVAGALGVAGAATALAGPAPAGRPAGATTVAPPTSARPSTTVAATSPVTTSATPSDAGTLPEPEGEAVDPVRTLVPRIAAIPAVLASVDDRRAAIDQALADPNTAIAVEDSPGTLCAVVPVAAPLMADGRWERNGESIASTGTVRRDPPGYGDCLPNDDGEPFRDGVYQYVAVGATGARSAAATIVVGVGTVVVWLLNNGEDPVCLVHASPTQADFYEAFSPGPPLQPGEATMIRLADVDHDVRLFGCPPDEVLRTTRVSPEPQTYVDLFDRPDTPNTTAAPTGPGGTATPTTRPATAAPTSAAATTTTTA
jgi:hypothetical protein